MPLVVEDRNGLLEMPDAADADDVAEHVVDVHRIGIGVVTSARGQELAVLADAALVLEHLGGDGCRVALVARRRSAGPAPGTRSDVPGRTGRSRRRAASFRKIW